MPDDEDAIDDRRRKAPMTVAVANDIAEQPLALVVSNGVDADVRPLGNIADPQALRIHHEQGTPWSGLRSQAVSFGICRNATTAAVADQSGRCSHPLRMGQSDGGM